MKIPADLQAAIDAEPRAKDMLATLSAQNRFALAFRIHNMKTEAGRKKKIETFVDDAQARRDDLSAAQEMSRRRGISAQPCLACPVSISGSQLRIGCVGFFLQVHRGPGHYGEAGAADEFALIRREHRNQFDERAGVAKQIGAVRRSPRN